MPAIAHRLALLTLATASGLAQAADFAPKGGRALLSVDFSYEATGRKADKYDLREWKLLRTLHIDAQLTATAPAATPSMQPLEAGQQARLQQQSAQAGKFAEQAAPLMASAEAIMAKCGSDEKCMEREAMRLGQSMAGTPQLDATLKSGRQTAAALQPDAARYQVWQGQSQTGNYKIDEKLHIVHADPICVSLPRQRCTRDEARLGSGTLAAAEGSAAMAEIDTGKSTISLQLPMAAEALAYTETITTDEPEGTHSVPTPKGPQKRQRIFMQADGQPMAPVFTVPLAGGWRSKSGVQTRKFSGNNEDGGTLTVRWRFQVQ